MGRSGQSTTSTFTMRYRKKKTQLGQSVNYGDTNMSIPEYKCVTSLVSASLLLDTFKTSTETSNSINSKGTSDQLREGKTLSEEEYSQFLNHRQQAKLQSLQEPSKITADNLKK